MSEIVRRLKLYCLIALVSLSSASLFIVATPSKAAAAGEAFNWAGANAIVMTGGALGDLPDDAPNDVTPNGGQSLYFQGNLDDGTYTAVGGITLKGGAVAPCVLTPYIELQAGGLEGAAAAGYLPHKGDLKMQIPNTCQPYLGWIRKFTGQQVNVNDTYVREITIGNIAKAYPALSKCKGNGAELNKCVVTTLDALGEDGKLKDARGDNVNIAQLAEAKAEDEDTNDNCPIVNGDASRWFACPIFEGMSTFTRMLDYFINEYMTTGNDIFEQNGGGYENAWKVFRNFAIGLVFIAGLVMLVSEAFNIPIVDAYTVRKVLPRLLVAVVGIVISWEFCEFLVGFFDDLGHAAGSIIYSSFTKDVNQGVDVTALIISRIMGAGAAAVGGIYLYATIGWMGILSLFGSLVLAMLVAAVALIIRQAIIVAAVILSPLAIAAYILPNTNKFANFWWDTLWRMGFLYPLATGLIALCKVLGKITMEEPSGADFASLISVITGTILFFAGYALIPFAFRLAGGLVATLGGITNDKSRGLFDRSKQYRANKKETNVAKMKSGERFQAAPIISAAPIIGNGRLASKLNAATNLASGAGIYALTKQRKARMAEHNALMAAQHAKSDAGQAAQFNDDVLRAQTYASEAEARSRLKQDFGMSEDDIKNALVGARANGGWGAARQVAAAKQLAATGTGYDDVGQMAKTIARVAGENDGSIADIVGAVRGLAARSGRYDLGGAGFGTVMGLAQKARSGELTAETIDDTLLEAARSTPNSSLMQGKPSSTSHISAALGRQLEKQMSIANDKSGATTPAQRVDARKAAAKIAAKMDNMKAGGMYGHEAGVEALYEGAAKTGTQGQGLANPLNESNRNTVINRVQAAPGGFDSKVYIREAQRGQYNPNDPNIRGGGGDDD